MPSKPAGPVLVTGASSGIGKKIVEKLSTSGHPVIAGVRKEADLAPLERLPKVKPILLDVTRSDDVTKATRMIRESEEGLYGLVNNAGIATLGPLVETSVDEMHRVFAVNFDGMHRMVGALFPFLRESKGRIVNISSVGGILVDTFLGPYGISKHAVEAYTEILREEVAAFGIHVSAIEPGAFRSELVAKAAAAEGAPSRSDFQNSIYRDVVLQAYDSFTSTPEALHRLDLPEPTPVAEAVADALFSSKPKPRYLVADKETSERVIDRVLAILRELNEQHPHTFSTSELEERLRKSLS
jgi:NAD(P)-dependent dehydrogenase (short-subunit alcohol dehydrogenase family)